ncbi:MAG TPA: beta-L-arabinofuranosidase domain-containing protein [Chloroflexota bacterium]|nr:beta-L-arabinofuranosidase domain-containing protein [Chloroflexota bacterium]
MGGTRIPVDTKQSPHAQWRTLSLGKVFLSGGFWAARQSVNADRSLGHGYRMLEEAGNLNNLRLAAGQVSGEYRGPVFQDSDVYKWLEAVGYQSALGLSRELQAAADTTIELVRAAQADDGYLDSYYQVVAPESRWTDISHGHELYCAGHLIQAAVAFQRCAGDGRLLDVVRRLVDHIGSVFGPDRRAGTPGHPEVEMALVELYRETEDARYLDLAKFFVDQRGRGLLGPSPIGGRAYYQDRIPVRATTELEGHAVRALYLASGVADVYLETGDPSLLESLERQWHDFVEHKVSVTGGAGARYDGEAFGRPYELPNEAAYNETCAAIASIMWNWRMLLATGEARFADLIESTLFNGFLSGVSLDGERFYYINPLLSRGEVMGAGRRSRDRQPWYRVACCPPNVMRLLASLGHYFATASPAGLQIHQYGASDIQAELAPRRWVGVSVATDYPWDGRIVLTVTETDTTPWELRLRRPGWCTSPGLRVAGQPVDVAGDGPGYLAISRVWQVGERVELTLPMPARLVAANPRLESTRDSAAIVRGPLVYCLEQVDSPTAAILGVQIDTTAPLESSFHPDVLGGVTMVQARGVGSPTESWTDGALYHPLVAAETQPPQPITLTAVPYYAWANRDPGAMRVWIPRVSTRS